jgi:hypothetical protein
LAIIRGITPQPKRINLGCNRINCCLDNNATTYLTVNNWNELITIQFVRQGSSCHIARTGEPQKTQIVKMHKDRLSNVYKEIAVSIQYPHVGNLSSHSSYDGLRKPRARNHSALHNCLTRSLPSVDVGCQVLLQSATSLTTHWSGAIST